MDVAPGEIVDMDENGAVKFPGLLHDLPGGRHVTVAPGTRSSNTFPEARVIAGCRSGDAGAGPHVAI